MAVANDYVTGTITLTNGSTDFTGTGTAWRLAGFRDGDRIYVDNLVAVIAPNSPTDPLIDSNTAGKLTTPWTGTTGTRAYRMSYKPDGARVTAETRNLIELLGDGNLEAIAALSPTAYALIRGNIGGTEWEKFAATAAAFALLDDPTASDMLTTLGFSTFIKTLVNDADAATARTTLGAQAALNYTPVQQGTGVGQSGNAVKLGWNNASALKATIDNLDLGRIWADFEASRVLTSNGYQKFPGGLILQWGSVSAASTDYAQAFPIAFPITCFAVNIISNFDTQPIHAFVINTSNLTTGSFDIRCRIVANGGTVAAQGNLPVVWMAVGI